MSNVTVFGYMSAYNTNTEYYISRLGDLHKKIDKIIDDEMILKESNIKTENKNVYNKQLQDFEKRYKEYNLKLQNKMEDFVGNERCYIPGLVMYGISVGIFLNISILEKCRNMLLEELNFLKNNGYSTIDNIQICWLDVNKRISSIENELLVLSKMKF